jgi:DeoR/GlpR family transcriptional regulator of sugar metabolism
MRKRRLPIASATSSTGCSIGFEGKLTTTKRATLEKCSHDTALRDIQGLIEQGLLKKDAGGGRSTSYSLTDELGA